MWWCIRHRAEVQPSTVFWSEDCCELHQLTALLWTRHLSVVNDRSQCSVGTAQCSPRRPCWTARSENIRASSYLSERRGYRSGVAEDTAGIAQSVQRLAAGWTVWGSTTGAGETVRTRPDRPWGPPSLLYNGYRLFPESKAVGAWRWPPTPI
jgi:hypothetical protein